MVYCEKNALAYCRVTPELVDKLTFIPHNELNEIEVKNALAYCILPCNAGHVSTLHRQQELLLLEGEDAHLSVGPEADFIKLFTTVIYKCS